MKKNKMMRLAACLLVMVLLTTSMIAGTFAKYTSEATASDSARVARWAITVEGTDITVDGKTTVTLDLFNTVNDTLDAKTEENISDSTGAIIAPGTTGSFALDIANTSEVDAEYTIVLNETNVDGIPIVYSLDNANWKESIGELNITKKKIDKVNGTDTYTVYWKWAFENGADGHSKQDDVKDTALGKGATATVTVDATINVTQID